MDQQPIPPPPPAPATSSDIRTWCVLCHAAALLGLFFHFLGHLLGPLIVWLVKRGDSPEVDAHGKESLNFQIPMLIALWVLNTVLVIIASIQASEGKFYRYPITIRLIK